MQVTQRGVRHHQFHNPAFCPKPGDGSGLYEAMQEVVKECQEADIIIAALGQPNFVKAEMVKEGAVVIDVGTTLSLIHI